MTMQPSLPLNPPPLEIVWLYAEKDIRPAVLRRTDEGYFRWQHIQHGRLQFGGHHYVSADNALRYRSDAQRVAIVPDVPWCFL